MDPLLHRLVGLGCWLLALVCAYFGAFSLWDATATQSRAPLSLAAVAALGALVFLVLGIPQFVKAARDERPPADPDEHARYEG